MIHHTQRLTEASQNCWGCTPEQSKMSKDIALALFIIATLAVFIVGLVGYYQKIPMSPLASYITMGVGGVPFAISFLYLIAQRIRYDWCANFCPPYEVR